LKIEVQKGSSEVEVIIKCPEVSEEVHKLVSLIQGFGEKFPGKKGGHTYLIDRYDVLYFESVDKRCFIYTTADVYETGLRLYEIEESLSEAGFFRSSKSQILNISKVESLCPEFGGRIEAIMENGERLVVSRQYSKLLKERLCLK